MRGPRRKLASQSRRQRRAAIAIILLASSPAIANEPEVDLVQNLPPLPLQSTVDAPAAQPNPFCEPLVNLDALKVQLASGRPATSIKLKPIGAAIGLHSISDTDAARTGSPRMTIEPVPTASIQTNPMAGSMHHHNDQLVDAEVDDRAVIVRPQRTDASDTTSAERSRRKTSIVLKPMASVLSPPPVETSAPSSPPVHAELIAPNRDAHSKARPSLRRRNNAKRPVLVPADERQPTTARQNATSPPAVQQQAATPTPTAQQPVAQQPVAQQPVAQQPIAQQPVAQQPTAQPTALQAVRRVAQQPVAQPPVAAPQLVAPETVPASPVEESIPKQDKSIVFSLSDKDDSWAEQSNDGDAAENHGQIFKPKAKVSLAAEPQPLVEAEPPAADVQPGNDEVASPAKVSIGVVEPISLADPAADQTAGSDLKSLESVLTDDSGEPIAIYGSERAVSGLSRTVDESLHSRRYRPPVAVRKVPISVVRNTADHPVSKAGSTVKPVEQPNLNDFPPITRSTKLTPLYMTRAQVRSLTLGGEVRRVQVANESICQAFTAGPNQLKLIGTGHGVTQLVVWAAGEDADAPPRMRSFEIHVKDAMQPPVDETIDQKARLLNQSISRAFPHANVLVRRGRDELIVAGTCESETTAKRIMRMVRKTCTVPVKDELVVR